MTESIDVQRRDAERIIDHYDDRMLRDVTRNYYNQSGYFNLGYWDESTKDQQGASANLVQKLMDLIESSNGVILDAGCGMGASTKQITRDYPEIRAIGINISERQLAMAKQIAHESAFIVMDAAQLSFSDSSLDNIISVEAAFHFNTRYKFLIDAFRVLKPGGKLVLSDMISSRWSLRINPFVPPENHVPTLSAYERIYQSVGFEKIQITDSTEPCLGGFSRYLRQWAWQNWRSSKIDLSTAVARLAWLQMLNFATRHYLLVVVTKPA